MDKRGLRIIELTNTYLVARRRGASEDVLDATSRELAKILGTTQRRIRDELDTDE